MIFFGLREGGEHDPACIDAARMGLLFKIAHGRLVRGGKPEHASFDLLKYAHPDIEHASRKLIAVVERAKYEGVLRQTPIGAARLPQGPDAPVVVRQIGARKVHSL